MPSINADPAKFRWKMKEGDREGLTIEFLFDITGYTAWKGQMRAAPIATSPAVTFRLDLSLAASNKVRWWLDNDEVLADYDGWGYDLEVVNPDGGRVTFIEGDITVDPQFTR